jgi:hypothetical protein
MWNMSGTLLAVGLCLLVLCGEVSGERLSTAAAV